jgi:tetratricopeptide (TPR) repeat protein/O-antigen ligase
MNDHVIRLMKLTFFLSPFIIITNICDFSGLPQSLFLQLSAIIILFVWLINIVKSQELKFKLTPLHVPVGLWVLWITISIIGETNTYEGILIARQWWTGIIFFFILSTQKWEKTQILLPAIFWSGFGVAVIGLAQFFWDIQWIPQVRAPSSTFGHKNVAIHYIMLTIPAGISLFLSSQDRVKNRFYAVALSIILLYIYSTYTRAGWVVLFFMLICLSALLLYDYKKGILPLWYSGKSVPFLVGIIVGLILLNGSDHQKNFSNAIQHMAGATQSVFQHMSQNMPGSEKSVIDNSFTGRLEVWLNSLAILKDYPITGVGVGNYRIHFQRYQNQVVECSWVGERYRVFNAHNDHVQFLVEFGLIGFGLWLFLLWRFFCIIIISFKQYTNPVSRYLLLCPFIAIINVLINACFSFPFQMAIPPVLFMVYLGMACSFYNDHSAELTVKIAKKVGYPILSLTILVFLGMLYVSYALVQSDRHFLKVIVAERISQWPLVISESKKALTYNPYNKEIYSFIGRAELESNQPQKAIKSFDQVLTTYPYHINCLANKGMALMKMNQPKLAVSCFKQVLHYLPALIKVRKILVNLYIVHQLYSEELIQELTVINKHEPNNIEVLSHLAVAYMKLSKFPEAIKTFQMVLQKQPDHAVSNTYMALIHLNAGKKELADIFYQHIKVNDQLTPHLLFALGRLALELNKPEALNYLIKASQQDINIISQLFDLAIAYKQKKYIDRAIRTYQILIHIQPSHAGAHNNLGNIFRDQHNTQQAFKEYLAAVTCDPHNPVFHFNAGLMAVQLKNYQTAEKAFKKAVQLKPDWALAHKNLAVLLYENQKKYTEAIFHFSKALNLDPMIENHETIRSILIRHTQNLNPYDQTGGGKP